MRKRKYVDVWYIDLCDMEEEISVQTCTYIQWNTSYDLDDWVAMFNPFISGAFNNSHLPLVF